MEINFTTDEMKKAVARIKRRMAEHGSFVSNIEDDLFKAGKGNHGDLIIRCQGKEWLVHKLILASRCEFFRACLEAHCKEVETGIVEMNEDDPTICGMFLEHIYNRKIAVLDRTNFWKDGNEDEYSGRRRAPQDITPRVIVALCVMADKYDRPSLLETVADFLYASPRFYEERSDQAQALLEIFIAVIKLGRPSAQMAVIKGQLLRSILHIGNIPDIFNSESRELLQENGCVTYELLVFAFQTLQRNTQHIARFSNDAFWCGDDGMA